MASLGMDGPRRATRYAATATGFQVTLRRNRSISPRGLLVTFALLAALATGIASAFAMLGAWLILPFAGLGALLLGAALWRTARHATDYERIERAREHLKVEVWEAGRQRLYAMDVRRACVRRREGLLPGEAPVTRLKVGRHLDARSRAGFAAGLEKRLQS